MKGFLQYLKNRWAERTTAGGIVATAVSVAVVVWPVHAQAIGLVAAALGIGAAALPSRALGAADPGTLRGFYAIVIGAALLAATSVGLVSCATQREHVREVHAMKVDAAAPEVVQQAQRAMNVAHAEIAKAARVVGVHKAAGALEASRADALLDELDARQKELVRLRQGLTAGNALAAMKELELRQVLVQRLTEEIAREVTARAAAKRAGST